MLIFFSWDSEPEVRQIEGIHMSIRVPHEEGAVVGATPQGGFGVGAQHQIPLQQVGFAKLHDGLSEHMEVREGHGQNLKKGSCSNS